jgi:hypothetical protein
MPTYQQGGIDHVPFSRAPNSSAVSNGSSRKRIED